MIKRNRNGEFEFRLNRPDAEEVYLVADFGDFGPSNVPMARTKSGEWVCRVQLDEGTYQFKYWADGKWCLDEDPEAEAAAPFLSSSLMVTHHSTAMPAYLG